ncbi:MULTISPECIES: hypothetical protein [Streptomyces]|uniref:hypothetical protein n=1 Tax=Streptomyces TaxID=1883 RepID=UPI000F54DA58|nr:MULTISPECIES: hypothetical protein [Streptomyces]RPK88799.1 hypothetical protein EES46_16740 [Streptomyces sp. ADI98-10]
MARLRLSRPGVNMSRTCTACSYGRIQELTLAGRTDAEIAAVLAEEAERSFDLLGPSLGDYAVAG